jgi:UDP-N-acetylmuramate dehydrogenase
VIASVFRLEPGRAPEALRRRARESLAIRKRTQPLDAPSAGCVFQNPVPGRDPVPEGVPASAGALIDRAGLKGSRIGGAVVSPIHGNFIVTEPGARAADVRALVGRCRRAVHDAFGVDLREEIRYLGDFGGD